MAQADVALTIHDSLVGQDPVGGDEIIEELRIDRARRGRRLGKGAGGGEGGDGAAEKCATRERRGRHRVQVYRRRARVARRSSSAPRKAASGGATGLSRRRTRPICRMSVGSSRIAASRRAATSSFAENSDVTESPRPASTNFFIASVLPSSIAARAVTRPPRNSPALSRPPA